MRLSPENILQRAVCAYLTAKRVLFYSIPNGSNKTKAERWLHKLTGLQAGVPDLCICVAKGGYHAMYLELKTKAGKTTEAQREWLWKLEDAGYRVAVAKGFDEAKAKIDEYMKL